MSVEKVTVLNTLTGQVGVMRKKHFDSPVFNRGHLVEVEPGKKSYNSALWKPRSADEYLEQRNYVRLGDVLPVTLPENTDTEEEDS